MNVKVIVGVKDLINKGHTKCNILKSEIPNKEYPKLHLVVNLVNNDKENLCLTVYFRSTRLYKRDILFYNTPQENNKYYIEKLIRNGLFTAENIMSNLII